MNNELFLVSLVLPNLFERRIERRARHKVIYRIVCLDEKTLKWHKARDLRPRSLNDDKGETGVSEYYVRRGALNPIPIATWYAKEGEIYSVTYKAIIVLKNMHYTRGIEKFYVAKKGIDLVNVKNLMALDIEEKDFMKYYLQPRLLFRKASKYLKPVEEKAV